MRKSFPAVLMAVIVVLCLFLCPSLNAQNVGIGTTSPSYRLHVNGDAASASDILYSKNNFVGDQDVIAITGNSIANPGYGIGVSGVGGGTGVLGAANATTYTGTAYGVYGSANGSAGTHVGIFGTASGGTVANWAGYFGSGNVYVQNNVGLGTTTPLNKLEVVGNTKTTNLQMTTGATSGYILQSDAAGNASWVLASSAESDPQVGIISLNYVPKWNGSALVTSTIFDDGNYVGIGNANPNNKLDVQSAGFYTGNFINTSTSSNNYGLNASCYNTPGYGYGLEGQGGKTGVYGWASLAGSGDRYGVQGIAQSGTSANYGLHGTGTGGALAVGVYGTASNSTNMWAGYFDGGNVYVNNSLAVGTLIPSLARIQVQGAVGNTVAAFSLGFNSPGISLVSDWPGLYFNSYYNGGQKAMAASGYPAYIGADQNSGGITFNTTSIANTVAGGAVTMNERMRIASGGFVGIGTTTPSYTLDVASGNFRTGNFINTATTSDFDGLYGSCNNTPGYGYGVRALGGYTAIYADATLAGTGGRFGLDAYGENGTEQNFGVQATAIGGSSTTNYGINTYAQGGTGAVNYGILSSASGTGATNWAGYFAGATFCTSGLWTGSDRKLKNDISPLSDALSLINKLNPSTYTFKTTEYKQMNLPEGQQYGLIADEVQQVLPGAVKMAVQPAEYENHDEMKGKKLNDAVEFNAVNYSAMIPILIGAVKEQQAIISNQDKKMADMQKQIDELKNPAKK